MAKPEDDSSIQISNSSAKEIKNALYARCANLPAEKVFTQADLQAFNVIPNDDVHQLLACTRQLTKEGLFKLMTKDGRACWKVVKKEDAAKYKSLSPEEALVYSYVESAGREGTWIRLLRARTNLHMTVMNRCLKALETKNYIKPIKSIKFPGRKTYMLAHLQPSEDITGGPFHTDGVLDEEFVHQMGYWTERYVIGRSWWHPPLHGSGKRKNRAKMSQEQAEDLRAQELEGREGRDPRRERSNKMLSMPPGYTGYPTIPEITKAINASGISGVVMKEAEMRQLLDLLCYDGRLYPVLKGNAYKAARQGGSDEDIIENGLMESPCGRCPVSDICEEGGPVNARTCEYFKEWLEM